jgi:hypothetical protein
MIWRKIGEKDDKNICITHIEQCLNLWAKPYICCIHTKEQIGDTVTILYLSNTVINKMKQLNPLNAELNPICHLLIILGDLTFMGPCIVSIFQYISNKMQRYTVYSYVETALHGNMDMSYARRVRTASHSSYTSYSVSHKWRHAAAAMRAYNVLCNSYNRITVEMNYCSFRSVRFALLYIVTRSKIV